MSVWISGIIYYEDKKNMTYPKEDEDRQTDIGMTETMREIKQCYIKPTRYKHDSGFRCFEVGYILKMDYKNNKVVEKKVLGTGSDHIFQDYMMLIGESPRFRINMDLTCDGYIRIFSHGGQIVWDNEDYAPSSAELRFIPNL